MQIQNTAQDSRLRMETSGECAENGQVELVQILLGRGDVYSDGRFELNGTGAGFTAGIGYLGQKRQTIDMNLTVNHWGQKTTCEINASGALKDDAQKIFRGTIDFKNGSAGSEGSEQETVLMLGDGVVNKTVPLILCAEEDVVGNHGATIGELDENTLFYFEQPRHPRRMWRKTSWPAPQSSVWRATLGDSETDAGGRAGGSSRRCCKMAHTYQGRFPASSEQSGYSVSG